MEKSADKIRFTFYVHELGGSDFNDLLINEHFEENYEVASIIIRAFKLMEDPGVSDEFIAELDAKYNIEHIISAFSTAYSLRCGFYFKAYNAEGIEIDEVVFDQTSVAKIYYMFKKNTWEKRLSSEDAELATMMQQYAPKEYIEQVRKDLLSIKAVTDRAMETAKGGVL